MKVVIAAALLMVAGDFASANATPQSLAVSGQSEQATLAKRCRYGSYRDRYGKRRCRRAPRGSH